eukprot:scaffold113670_cov33-Phaeocystis_antarctica.AAC.1
MPPGHVQCKSARRVTATGAPPSQATPVPPTGSARTATVRAAAVRTGGESATSGEWCDSIIGVRAGSPYGGGAGDSI